MKDAIIISQGGYEDTGLDDFVFVFNGKKYKVTAKDNRYDVLEGFYKYIKYIDSGKRNPFTYPKKNLLNIENISNPKSKEPNAEQMSLFSSKLDSISNLLENKGLIKESHQLDIISNTIDSRWKDSEKKHNSIKVAAEQTHWLKGPSSYIELRKEHDTELLHRYVQETINMIETNAEKIPKDLYERAINTLREIHTRVK